jgi:hypothetical protein
MTDSNRLMIALCGAALIAFAASAPPAYGQTETAGAGADAQDLAPPEAPAEVGGWPKITFDTTFSLEYAGMSAPSGPERGPDLNLRSDSTFLAEFNNALSAYGLFQVKSRSPLDPSDPNKDLFINQGAGREEGIKTKELYIRYGDYRFGKFVQNFGRGFAFLVTPTAADFVEEPEEGYEPADMIGVEKIRVFDNEDGGWRQLTFSAFMVDRTFLHQSWPFNEGYINYKDGGVGNTLWPENILVTYDVLNHPVGNWAHMNYQASVLRWGKSYGEQDGEWWTTLGSDISIPLKGSVADTLSGDYTQVKFYLEGARRDNFQGVSGRLRTYLSASAEYMNGPLVFDLTTTQRWTTDDVLPLQKDELYTASVGYTLPSQTVAALSVAQERVGDRHGVYFGIRLTQTLTTASRAIAKGRYY